MITTLLCLLFALLLIAICIQAMALATLKYERHLCVERLKKIVQRCHNNQYSVEASHVLKYVSETAASTLAEVDETLEVSHG